MHPGVALAEPLPAELERRAVIQDQTLGAPADALAGLDHGHLVPARHEPPGGGQPGQPGADHDDVAHMTPASHVRDGSFPDRLPPWRTDRRRLVLLIVAPP